MPTLFPPVPPPAPRTAPILKRNPTDETTLTTMSSTTATSSSTLSTSTYNTPRHHPYLADTKAEHIRSWSAGVPHPIIAAASRPSERERDRDTMRQSAGEEYDPAVQAYIQAKMALFQSVYFPATTTNTMTAAGEEKARGKKRP